MLHACAQKIDVTGNLEIFLGTKHLLCQYAQFVCMKLICMHVSICSICDTVSMNIFLSFSAFFFHETVHIFMRLYVRRSLLALALLLSTDIMNLSPPVLSHVQAPDRFRLFTSCICISFFLFYFFGF